MSNFKVSLQNLGTVNQNMVELNGLTIWFSYETPVAFRYLGELTIRQNDWNTTTGKLLNKINPNKDLRITGEEFEKRLETILEKILV